MSACPRCLMELAQSVDPNAETTAPTNPLERTTSRCRPTPSSRSVFVLLLGFAVSLLYCVPSLSPLFTEKDLIADPALVGTWSAEGSEETWTFEAREGKSYRLVIRGDGKTAAFEAHLLVLRGRRFLDLFPDREALEATDLGTFYQLTLVPAHLFLKVGELGPELELSLLETKWLDELLARHPRAIDHRRHSDGGIVLTASTRELQRFVLKHVDDSEAFDESWKMARRSDIP